MKKITEMSKEELVDFVKEFQEEYTKQNKIYPFQWKNNINYKVGCKILWNDFLFVCKRDHISKDFTKDRKYWRYE